MLPDFWQGLALANPILYLINGLRFGMLGISDVSIYLSFLIIVSALLIMFYLCLYYLNNGRGLRY